MNSSISTSDRLNIRFLVAVTITVLICFPLCYALLSLQDGYLPMINKTAHNKSKVIYFGNSIIDARSACDSDMRSLPQMLSDETGMSVADVSKGGLYMVEIYALTNLLNEDNKPDYAVLPLSEFFGSSLGVKVEPGYNQMATRDLLISLYSMNKPFIYPSAEAVFSSAEEFSYKGQYYGSYADIKRDYMTVEKKHLTCPERFGENLKYVEFMHWKNYASGDFNIDGEMFERVLARLKALQIKPVIYLTPVNFQLMSELNDSEVLTTLNARLQQLRGYLDDRGIEYVDLTHSLDPSGFTDMYCACGHLSEVGRKQVVKSIAPYVK